MRDWRTLLAVLIPFVGIATRARAEPTGAAVPEKEIRALIQDVRGYLRRLDRVRPRAAAEARREIANGPRNLAAELAAMRKAGLPLTPAEVREPALPLDQDSAPLYRRLIPLLKQRPLDPQLTAITREIEQRTSLTDEKTATLRKLLADRQDVLDLIHQAGDRPACSLRSDWEHEQMPLWLVSPLRDAGRLLRAESLLLAHDGRLPDAVANQTRALRIAQHAASDPLLVNYAVSVAIYRIALDGMKDLLSADAATPETLDSFRQAILAHRAQLDLKRALRGETVYLILGSSRMRRDVRQLGTDSLRPAFLLDLNELIQEAQTGHPTPRKVRKPVPKEARIWEGLLCALEARELQQRRRLIAALDKPYAERQAVFQQIDRSLDISSCNPVALLMAWSGLRYSESDTKRMRARAQESVLTAGAAVLAYRAKQGSFPETLQQALPDPPPDPFTGRPLQYRRTADGFRIESVGREYQAPTVPSAPGAPIGFTYPPPPSPPRPPSDVLPRPRTTP
jgi:hypothetical protein